jgi:hypothetical protein
MSLQQSQVRPARVLLLTHRDVQPVISRCMTYELEDIVCEVDAAALASVRARSATRIERGIERLLPRFSARILGSRPLRDEPFDLLYVSLHTTSDVARVQPLGHFLSMARQSAINLDEVWRVQLAERTGDLAMLRRFDHVFTACAGSVDDLSRALDRPCHYLAPSVDALRFCPFPHELERRIDVYFMGRRRPELHRAIQEVTARTNRFYLYDTVVNPVVLDCVEHRIRLAELIGRSRTFVVDIASSDRTAEIGQQPELGTRFFEGAAAGSLMIGVVPETATFAMLFGWPDAVIPLEPRAEAVAQLLASLDANPRRVAEIRRTNVIQSLLRHDGVYRWEQILRAVGLEPLPALYERKRRLEQRAKSIQGADQTAA